jgi:hypothetical protein
MARARFIRPEFFTDEKIGELPMAARLLFIGSWCHADINGVLEWRPKQLRALVFPHDENIKSIEVEMWMSDLVSSGLVTPYQYGSTTYAQITNFQKHQTFTKSEHDGGPRHPVPEGFQTAPRNMPGHTRVPNSANHSATVVLPLVAPSHDKPSPSPEPSPSPTPEHTPAQKHVRTHEDDLFPPGPPSNSPIEKPEDDGILPFCERNYSKIYKKAQVLQFKVFENNWMSWQAVFKTYDDETIKDAKEITISSQRVPAVIDDICKLIKTGEEKRKIQPRWTTLEAAEEWERHVNPEFKFFAKPDDMKKHWPRLRIESIKNYLKNCGYDLERAK